MSELQNIRRYLETTAERVSAARRLVAAGQSVDLTGLEQEVDAVCGAITAMPADERDGLKLPMVGLVDELDKLSNDLREQHRKLEKGLRTLTSSNQAVKAYGKGPAVRRK